MERKLLPTPIVISFLLLTSCAKTAYLTRQGWGQLSLIYRGKKNEKVLQDKAISQHSKDKIKKIIKYKEWFYNFYQLPESKIYRKTVFLPSPAVTYLVIASPFNQVKAKEECFPFVGCFPYLGHFSLEHAKEWAKKLEEEGWITWTRPVYAYSTLGKFNDPILSSFFHYNDEDLAELIFHELFHTVFFVKSEVDLNENLAEFFASKMREIYFKKKKTRPKTGPTMITLIKNLNRNYQKHPHLTLEQAQKILDTFIRRELVPSLNSICQKYDYSPCSLAQGPWNNARLASYTTYRGYNDEIENLYRRGNFASLKHFLEHLQERHRQYKEAKNPPPTFRDFIFSPLNGVDGQTF